jgi:hypothetical protein
MRREARLLPLMLQNRMSIEVEVENLPAEYPLTVLARLREIYQENITSASQLLPRLPDGNEDILECYTRDTGSFLVAEIEGNTVKFDCQ